MHLRISVGFQVGPSAKKRRTSGELKEFGVGRSLPQIEAKVYEKKTEGPKVGSRRVGSKGELE